MPLEGAIAVVTKKFRISGDQIRPVAVGFGSCIASDRITVDGVRIGYMYRETPDNKNDSGWRFLAGDESEAYLNDPRNFEIYDVNTIANYDSAIASLVEGPVGSVYRRDYASGKFVAASDFRR